MSLAFIPCWYSTLYFMIKNLHDFDFFKLTQPLTYFFKLAQTLRPTHATSNAFLLFSYCTLKEKGEKLDIKPYLLPYGLRNPYRNLKS
jgi:hypothetical protein